MSGGTGTPPTKKELMKRLESLNGCGTMKRKLLANKFQTAEALLSASVDDIAAIEKIGRPKAKEIHQVIRGELVPQPKWAGVARAVLWNKLTKKKVAGGAAPTVDNAEAWIKSHPNYELYNGQDQQQKSELHVPEQCKMSGAAYQNYCMQPTGDEKQLQENLSAYNLKLGHRIALPPGAARTLTDELKTVLVCIGVTQFGHVCRPPAPRAQTHRRKSRAPSHLPH